MLHNFFWYKDVLFRFTINILRVSNTNLYQCLPYRKVLIQLSFSLNAGLRRENEVEPSRSDVQWEFVSPKSGVSTHCTETAFWACMQLGSPGQALYSVEEI